MWRAWEVSANRTASVSSFREHRGAHRAAAGRGVRTGVLLTAILWGIASSAGAAAPPDVAAAIAALVDSGVHPELRWPRFPDFQADVRRAYESEQFVPLWVREGEPTAQSAAAISAFATADAKGLDATDYDAGWLAAAAERLRASGALTPEEVAEFDVALTVSLMRFASAAYSGKINPRRLGYSLDVQPKKFDLWSLVGELAHDPDPGPRIAALDPPFPLYARLQSALTRYRELAARPDLKPVPNLTKLRPGDDAPGVPALRAWLTALGDLPADAPASPHPDQYDQTLAAAVKVFQHRHGLDPDAVIGPATLRALQVPPARRLRQIQLAMERLRWLPYAVPDRFVVVNIPEFRLRGFEGGELVPRVDMGVVVGSSASRTHTPVLNADMRYLIFRPYWLVPTSIARNEIFPKADRDPSYLERHNMEVVNGRVRQRPGRNNSLGLLKFIFPNRYNVYLHDTPAKALFQRSRRDFSHGCIRVADPPALAEFVLGTQNGWDRQRIRAAMTAGRDDRRVDLPVPVPVYVLYTTVVVEVDGRIYFFDDIYGHDAKLDALLAKGYPYP
jgi:murein L,D-transpeptidase YcbB/YkuD